MNRFEILGPGSKIEKRLRFGARAPSQFPRGGRRTEQRNVIGTKIFSRDFSRRWRQPHRQHNNISSTMDHGRNWQLAYKTAPPRPIALMFPAVA
jgi:hypothetical protein